MTPANHEGFALALLLTLRTRWTGIDEWAFERAFGAFVKAESEALRGLGLSYVPTPLFGRFEAVEVALAEASRSGVIDRQFDLPFARFGVSPRVARMLLLSKANRVHRDAYSVAWLFPDHYRDADPVDP